MNKKTNIQQRAEQIVDRIDTEIVDNAIEVMNEFSTKMPTNKDIEKAIKDMEKAVIKEIQES